MHERPSRAAPISGSHTGLILVPRTPSSAAHSTLRRYAGPVTTAQRYLAPPGPKCSRRDDSIARQIRTPSPVAPAQSEPAVHVRHAPPPLVFAAEASAPARSVVPPVRVDRLQLSQDAERRRTFWVPRVCALTLLLTSTAGVWTAIDNSKIMSPGRSPALRPTTLLTAQQLHPTFGPREQHGHHHEHGDAMIHAYPSSH